MVKIELGICPSSHTYTYHLMTSVVEFLKIENVKVRLDVLAHSVRQNNEKLKMRDENLRTC